MNIKDNLLELHTRHPHISHALRSYGPLLLSIVLMTACSTQPPNLEIVKTPGVTFNPLPEALLHYLGKLCSDNGILHLVEMDNGLIVDSATVPVQCTTDHSIVFHLVDVANASADSSLASSLDLYDTLMSAGGVTSIPIGPNNLAMPDVPVDSFVLDRGPQNTLLSMLIETCNGGALTRGMTTMLKWGDAACNMIGHTVGKATTLIANGMKLHNACHQAADEFANRTAFQALGGDVFQSAPNAASNVDVLYRICKRVMPRNGIWTVP